MFQTENDKLYIKTIFESQETLIVPKYQRGYRWGEKQVLELLNDLNEIISKNNDREKEYCLNPISLFENSEGKIVIVDGQQRLTTFLILYYYLNQTINVKLLYEARNDKENILTILKEFKQNENKENFNIDEYYFSIAFATIEKFFKTNNKEAFITYFNEKSIYYYLYEIKSSDEYNVFIRMNKEKIPLTEGELIKSLFIDYDEGERIKKENEGKINISFVWDLIEQKLHDEDFWYFIHNVEKSNKFNIEGSNDCRIGYILEIVAKINNYKDESILKFYYDEYKEFINNKENKIKKYWYDIEHCFGVLNDWFDDIEMYHYVGFILYFSDNVKDKIVELYNIFKKDSNKEEFINELKAEIGKIILKYFIKNKKLEISNWDELIKYQFDGENLPKTNLMPILLLANIQYVMRQITKQKYAK